MRPDRPCGPRIATRSRPTRVGVPRPGGRSRCPCKPRAGAFARASLLLATLLAPTPALAHASERMIILTLPTGRYILGAATVVALTALLGALAPRLPAFRSRRLASFPTPAAPPRQLARLRRPRRPRRHRLPRPARPPRQPPHPHRLDARSGSASPSPRCSSATSGAPSSPGPAPSPSPAASSAAPAPSASPASATGPPSPASSPSPGSRSSPSPPTTPPSSPAPSPSTGSLIFALAVLEGPAWLRQGEALTLFFRYRLEDRPALVDPRRRRIELHAGPPGAQILATAAALPLRRRLRHPRPRHRHLRRPAPHLLVAHPSRHQPARVPRPLRRHPRPTPSASSPPGR